MRCLERRWKIVFRSSLAGLKELGSCRTSLESSVKNCRISIEVNGLRGHNLIQTISQVIHKGLRDPAILCAIPPMTDNPASCAAGGSKISKHH
jgi:hypothetical protein